MPLVKIIRRTPYNITRHAIGPKIHVKVEYFIMKWTTNHINHENHDIKKLNNQNFLYRENFNPFYF